MDSVVHAENSSSASANLQVTIRNMEWASAGVLKVYPEEGPSFFVRMVYLSAACVALLEQIESLNAVSAGRCASGTILSAADSEALLVGARAFLAERIALEYLARAEQCRFQLSLKVRKKGYAKTEVDLALGYLESAGLLDDERYAGAWLRNHSIHQSEGRQKLLAGLVSRGISQKIATFALDEYFSSTTETELCKKAIEKLVRIGKKDDKLLMALARKGFSRKTVEDSLKER